MQPDRSVTGIGTVRDRLRILLALLAFVAVMTAMLLWGLPQLAGH